jgi:nucleoside-diphosphate-sugar epimerase
MDNFWKDKKVLLTGGAGFIGSNLAKDLVALGAHIAIIDNFERGKIEYISEIYDSIVLFKGDLKNKYFCEVIFSRPIDIVIHMASKVGGIGYYTSRPYEVISEMLQADSNVLESVLENNIPNYFYASSAHIYPIELQGTPDSDAITEDQAYPANPELSYGWAKLIAERQIEYACKENPSLRAAIARYIGIFGPNQDYALETGSVIPVFTHRAIKHPEIPFSVWGTGQETRSYCYIDDAVECTKLMIEKMQEKQIVGPYNVGKQERIKIEDIAKKIIDMSGKDISIEYDATKETLIWGQWCDCTLAAKELDGWKAKVPFDEGLKKINEDLTRRLSNERT